ncbi:hypothetical protein KSF73_02545 [Burkholderiaceae bacterium DAT-1]|nr:hypothetical protein [Burkholderiaceae bacterium DAT-1]
MNSEFSPEFILIPAVVMLAPVLILLIVMHFRTRRAQARYQLLLQLADKGVELPLQLITEPEVAFCERRRGIVLISSGLGMMAMLLSLPVHTGEGDTLRSFWGIGLLPLMTGAGYLVSWWLNQRERSRD